MALWIGAVALGLGFASMALGVYLTFRGLSFPDLTIDGSFPLGASVAAVLVVRGGWEPWLTLPAAAAAGALAGATTGLLATRLKVNGLLAGILVSIGLWTVNLRVMGDRSNVPLLGIRTILSPVEDIVGEVGHPLGLTASDVAALIVFGALAVAIAVALNWFLHTEMGLGLRATGDNERMIRALGINTDSVKVLGLALANALVAVSGVLISQYQGFSDVSMGLGMIIAGLASVILGETLFRPAGVGQAIASVAMGSILYRLVIALALFVGLAPTDMRLVTAVIVVLVMTLPQVRRPSAAVAPRPLLGMVRR
jgi:putative ABC transport system permease protein